jgi:Pup amidohydrolase
VRDVAIPKVVGIETEYGIVVKGQVDANPIASSSLLVNAYLGEYTDKIVWDFEDESPANDARGFSLDGAMPPEVETHLVNAVLTNGARFYVDHAHPEVSTPECLTAREIVAWDKAGEEIMRRGMAAAREVMPNSELVVYKNNSDGKGNSYGCHENYLMARDTPFGRIVSQITTHFVTRQIICGAGKVGCELPGVSARDVPYQISQRADFFEEEVGLETTLKRPIVNTRDEPHCDSQKYRRLHVIVGDANMAEWSTYLKVGTTAIVLAMIEDDFLGPDLTLANPVRDIKTVSHDPSLTAVVVLRDGRRMTAIDVQWQLLERARKYERERGLEPVGVDVGNDVLAGWERVLTGLETDRNTVAHLVDWVAKERILEAFRERHGIGWNDARLRALDLQYHDVRPEKSVAARAGLATMVTDDEMIHAVTEPPTTTRAYFRGRCLTRFADSIVAANWDSLVFDIGSDPLRRVPMMEPLRGTEAHVGALIDGSKTARELLDKLGA